MEKIWKKRFESNDFAARFFKYKKLAMRKNALARKTIYF